MKPELYNRLNRMFNPKSVAVIGAGATPDKVGFAIMDSLVTGGFQGNIYPINPKYDSILGVPVVNDVDGLPEVPDLAVVALNQRAAVSMIARLREMGVAGASVIAGGFAEMGQSGLDLQSSLKEAAGAMPIIGPNTLGFLNSYSKLNVTFYPRILNPGPVSFISQSGGIGLGMKGRADDEGMGFGKWIGVGNRVNIEFHTLVEYMREDPQTKVIGIFLEGCSESRKLIEQIRATTPTKPVVFLKGGRGAAADTITITHTGAAAGEANIWTGALRQAGAISVQSVTEMIAVCKALSIGKVPAAKRVAIFTHTAGPSIVAWDILQAESGCELAQLNQQTLARIAEILGPSVPVIHKNPVDGAAGAFLPDPFHKIAETILLDPSTDVLLAIFCEHKNWRYPTDELIDLSRRYSQPIIACFIGSLFAIAKDRERLSQAHIPTYVLPEDAAIGLKALLGRIGR